MHHQVPGEPIKSKKSKKSQHKYTYGGFYRIKAKNSYLKGVVGTDIKLTLSQKIRILFAKGISVCLFGSEFEGRDIQ